MRQLFELSHLLVDRAREQHDTLMIGQGYRDVGIAHLMMRSSEPALKALDSALFYYSTRQDSAFLRGAGAAENNMAYAHKNSGRLKTPCTIIQLSLGLHERAKDPRSPLFTTALAGSEGNTRKTRQCALLL
ncbi:MAG: hypothetical protein IPI00_06475 [Flavobacteriales bacterium]|nr:hypothetical protein [Flavobacteriales bacterium]